MRCGPSFKVHQDGGQEEAEVGSRGAEDMKKAGLRLQCPLLATRPLTQQQWLPSPLDG